MKPRKNGQKKAARTKGLNPSKPIDEAPAVEAPPGRLKGGPEPLDPDLFSQLCVEVVRRLMERHQVSLHQLQRACGMDRHAARRLLAGRVPQYSLYVFVRLCNALPFRPSRILRTVESCLAEDAGRSVERGKQD